MKIKNVIAIYRCKYRDYVFIDKFKTAKEAKAFCRLSNKTKKHIYYPVRINAYRDWIVTKTNNYFPTHSKSAINRYIGSFK